MDKLIKFLNENYKIWSIYKEDTNTQQVFYVNNKKEKVENIERKGLEVKINGLYRYTTNELNEDKIINDISKIKIKTSEDIAQSSERGIYKIKPKFDENPEELIKDIIKYVNEELKLKCKVRYIRDYERYIYINSNGCEVEQEIPYSHFGIKLIKSENDRVMMLFKTYGKIGDEALYSVDYDELKETKKLLDKLINAPMLKPGKYNILLDEELTGILTHEAYGHALEKDLIEEDDSVFSNEENLKINLGKNVNIYSDPTQKYFGHYIFDSEGFRGKHKTLIKEGNVVNFLENERYGRGGDGRKYGYAIDSIPRMSNIFFAPGEYSDEELFEELKNGVYICDPIGGQVNTKSGTFQFGFAYAYEIENGEIKQVYKGISFSGSILKIGHKIECVGKETKEVVGFCGKNCSIRVAEISPKVLIKDYTLGGE